MIEASRRLRRAMIIQAALTFMRVISVIGGVSIGGLYSRPALTVHEYFDAYGNVSWEDEKAHLDNFALALQRDLNLTGYIVVYAGRRACLGEAKYRALRAMKYVVKTHNIRENRIRWIDGGYQEELRVILQPLEPDAPEFIASPTLNPSEVIIKNCKPKSTKLRKRHS
jgi:hypothetical protein